MKSKIYDLVKELLTDYPELRDSDKRLQWKVFSRLGYVDPYVDRLTYDDWMSCPSTETIRRCRQKIQELNPDLGSSKRVKEKKNEKEAQRGTFIFREPIKAKEQISWI